MSCQAWWCGGDVVIELGRVPPGTPVILACGCAVERLDAAQASVAVRVRGAVCADHADAPPHDLPPDTPVQLDLLASLLRQAP